MYLASKKLIITLFISIFFISSYSQYIGTKINVKPVESKELFPKYNYTNYDVEHGLNSSYILSLFFDNKGFLWIGTTNGVSVFDGIHFKNFTKADGLASDIIQDINQDKNGKIYFACMGGGLTIYDGYEFKSYNETNGLKNLNVWTVLIDNKENIIAGTENGLFYFKNGKISEFKYNSQFKNVPIREISQDKQGKYWIATDGNYLFSYKNDTLTQITEGIPSKRINSIVIDDYNNKWIGTYGSGLLKIDKNNNFEYFLESNKVNSRYINKIKTIDNKIIVASSSGIYELNNDRILVQNKNNNLENEIIIDIAIDKNSNYWYATYGKGLYKFNGYLFKYFDTESGLPANNIKGIKSYNNKLWFATSGNGICSYDGNSITNYNYSSGISNDFILSIEADSSNLWLGTSGGGLNKFTIKENTFYNKKDGYKGDYILCVHKDNFNNVWYGTYGLGLNRFNNNEFKNYSKKDGIDANIVNSIKSEKNGKIWIATDGNGLFSLENNNFKRHLHDIQTFKTLYYDNNSNTLYAGTHGHGLIIINNSDTIRITEKDGLTNNYVQSIYILKNKLYIGTNKGLNIVEFNRIQDLKDKNFTIKKYEISNGFIGNNCFSNSIYIDSLYQLWIGTGKNLTCFNTQINDLNNIRPYVFINNINLFFESVDWKKELIDEKLAYDSLIPLYNIPTNIILPYNRNHITFYFNALNYKNPKAVKFSTMLEGQDNNWSPYTNSNYITFSGLSNGEYIFKIKAINEDNIESENIISFKIKILPPWWKTKSFYIISILLLLSLIIFIIKYRERKLVKEKIKLEKIVKERTIEISQQKEEIEAQRDNLEFQNEIINHQKKEILDSIYYAKRIQNAILPVEQQLQNKKIESFALFTPKDIVSGDFYWTKTINNYSIYCVADCTGHGVPGAFMSMLGISSLNEILSKIDISQTTSGQILDLLRKKVIETLHSYKSNQSSEIKDGMDISLIIIEQQNINYELQVAENDNLNTLAHKHINTFKCQWSGANNPLYLITNYELQVNSLENNTSTHKHLNTLTQQLYEIKGDKMPIAVYDKMDNFTTNYITLNPKDTLYLFTDGFADQFGGENGKKFKYKPFKELLVSINEKDMNEQKNLIHQNHINWRNNNPQVDDICIVGIRIKN